MGVTATSKANASPEALFADAVFTVSEIRKFNNVPQLVQRLDAAAEAAGRLPGGAGSMLEHALIDTRRHIEAAGFSSDRLEHPVNLPLRLSWIDHELDLYCRLKAASDTATPEIELQRKKCVEYRRLLSGNTPLVWDHIAEAQSYPTTRDDLAPQIRLFSSITRQFRDEITGLLNTDASKCPDAFYRYEVKCMEAAARVGIVIQCEELDRGAIFKELAVLCRIAHAASERPVSALRNEALHIVRGIEERLDSLAAQHLPERTIPGMSIDLYWGRVLQPSAVEMRRLEAINERLTISPHLLEPQLGFGGAYTAEQLRELMSADGARVFLVRLHDEPVGYYILNVKPESFPARANEVIGALRRSTALPENGVGWFEIVGITEKGREAAADWSRSAYSLLHDAVVSTALYSGLTEIVCQCRAGVQANLALPKHLARGFEYTGVQVPNAKGVPYDVLRLDLERRSRRQTLEEIDQSIRSMRLEKTALPLSKLTLPPVVYRET